MIITTSYTVLVTSIFIIGMMATIRAQVGFIYIYENMRAKHYERCAAVIGFFEGTLALIGALYFMLVSKDWFPLVFGAFCVSICGAFGVFFLHESPRYLIKSGQIGKA